MVVARHTCEIKQVVGRLKQAATVALDDAGLNPMSGRRERSGATPSPWARGCWKVFRFTNEDVRRAVRYVEQNPLKEGLRAQRWGFVTADDW